MALYGFDQLFKLADSYNMKACAITDHGNMFGVADFYFAAKELVSSPFLVVKHILHQNHVLTEKLSEVKTILTT